MTKPLHQPLKRGSTVVSSVRIYNKDLERIQKLADREGRTRNNMIQMLLQRALELEEQNERER